MSTALELSNHFFEELNKAENFEAEPLHYYRHPLGYNLIPSQPYPDVNVPADPRFKSVVCQGVRPLPSDEEGCEDASEEFYQKYLRNY